MLQHSRWSTKLPMVEQSQNTISTPKPRSAVRTEFCFPVSQFSLENEIGTVEKAICECDKKLTFTLQPYTVTRAHQRYKNTNCYHRDVPLIPIEPSCCADPNGLFSFYRAETDCCEADGEVLEAGTCVNDIGVAYEERVRSKE